MKFFLLLIIHLLVACAVKSQVEFAMFAGPQATSVSYKANNYKQPAEHKYGFQAGASLKVFFDENLYFAPALYYSLKGYKVTFNQFLFPPSVDASDNNTTIHTLETAFLLQYDFGKKPGKVFLRLGPSLDFQLFGKEEFNTVPSGSTRRNMEYNYSAYGHYAANLLFHFGYEAPKGFLIFAQHTRGVTSLNNSDDGPRMRHRTYGITIGKLIRHK